MKNDVILVSPIDEFENDNTQKQEEEYLTIKGALTEISNNNYSEQARNNLNIYSKQEIESFINSLTDDVNDLSSQVINIKNDQQEFLETTNQTLEEFVKIDGSTPFTSVQNGQTPGDTNLKGLVTVEYIKNKLTQYFQKSEVINKISKEIEEITEFIENNYVLEKDVYTKEYSYNKNKIDQLLKDYVRTDGTSSISKPSLRSQVANKGYVDDQIKTHKDKEIDPHGFQAKINSKLSNYYKRGETYSRAQTYSRDQIDKIIDKLVSEAYQSLIQEHINTISHLDSQDVSKAIKIYATNNLIYKKDLSNLKSELSDQILQVKPIWKTSGPVLTTVGFVEDNSEVPSEMTMQEILDAIFYGQKISISVDKEVTLGDTTDITVCVHGGISIESGELYQGNVLLERFTNSDFNGGCVTVPSNPIVDDTKITFKVIYSNGSEQEESKIIKAVFPVFVGSLPKWRILNEISFEYLQQLCLADKSNKFISIGSNLEFLTNAYDFKDAKLRKLCVILPITYPDPKSISIQSQEFSSDAFERLLDTPLIIQGKSCLYKVFAYKQGLSKLNQEVTFKF